MACDNRVLRFRHQAVVQHNNKLILPVDTLQYETCFLHSAAHSRDAGITVLCVSQAFGHNGENRIAGIGVCKTEIFDRHTAIQGTWAVNFQPIAEKVNLNGRALGVNTVIAVNERIQHSFRVSR